MEFYTLIGGAVLCISVVVYAVRSVSVSQRGLAEGMAVLDKNVQALKQDPGETPKKLQDEVQALKSTVQELERRVEAVHEEALDYLRRGEGARNRARQLRKQIDEKDEVDEGPELSEEEAQRLLDTSQSAPENSNHGHRQLSLSEIEARIASERG